LNFDPDNKLTPRYLASVTNDNGLSPNMSGSQGNLKRASTRITTDLLLFIYFIYLLKFINQIKTYTQ